MRDKGLYKKFVVLKNGKLIEDCFVLRPTKDNAALQALKMYAEYTDDEELKEDLEIWIQEIESEPATAA